MSAFLRYVVEQTLIGNTRRIKAFTVGIEALGKPASFDPQTDPSVRVLAKRLRSSLETYYLQNPDTLVFIEMKPGSYVPKFLLRREMAAARTPTPSHDSHHPAIAGADNPHANGTAVDVIDRAAGPDNATNLSVSQQQAFRERHADLQTNPSHERNSETDSDSVDAQRSRQSGISQLWQAYKSASRVA
jgi:hypothetical protein